MPTLDFTAQLDEFRVPSENLLKQGSGWQASWQDAYGFLPGQNLYSRKGCGRWWQKWT